jgi:hypothetical protein
MSAQDLFRDGIRIVLCPLPLAQTAWIRRHAGSRVALGEISGGMLSTRMQALAFGSFLRRRVIALGTAGYCECAVSRRQTTRQLQVAIDKASGSHRGPDQRGRWAELNLRSCRSDPHSSDSPKTDKGYPGYGLCFCCRIGTCLIHLCSPSGVVPLYFLDRSDLWITVKPYSFYYFPKENFPLHNIQRTSHITRVRSMRSIDPAPSLDTQGFEVHRLDIKMKYSDFKDEELIQAIYFKELEEYFKEKLGAEEVRALDFLDQLLIPLL